MGEQHTLAIDPPAVSMPAAEVLPPAPASLPATRKRSSRAPAIDENLSEDAAILSMIARASRDPKVDADKMARIFEMHAAALKMRAEREYNAAMSDCQAELVPIAKRCSNKQTNSRYADLAAIAEQAGPVITKHGFGLVVSEFPSDKPNCVGILLHVTHRGGHSIDHKFNVPLDEAGIKGTKNKTDVWAYASTLTYGRRYAECAVFNIATKNDLDGQAVQEPEQKDWRDTQMDPRDELAGPVRHVELQRLIDETYADVPGICRYFGRDSLMHFTCQDVDRAIAMLNKKKADTEKRQAEVREVRSYGKLD